jgi:N utilization substance protein B
MPTPNKFPATLDPAMSRSDPWASRPQAKATMTRRSRGREIALQVLYLLEQNPEIDPAEVERFIRRRLADDGLRKFARELVEGVRSDQTRIDSLISEVAENWRLDRMAAIDRNILRLGAFELLSAPGIPSKVAINEALELAKRYSTAQSSRFVNGILDRLIAADLADKAKAEGGEVAAEEGKPKARVQAKVGENSRAAYAVRLERLRLASASQKPAETEPGEPGK